jgi:hypothetical protein
VGGFEIYGIAKCQFRDVEKYHENASKSRVTALSGISHNADKMASYQRSSFHSASCIYGYRH